MGAFFNPERTALIFSKKMKNNLKNYSSFFLQMMCPQAL